MIVDRALFEAFFYVHNTFTVALDFGVTSIHYDVSDLLSKVAATEKIL